MKQITIRIHKDLKYNLSNKAVEYGYTLKALVIFILINYLENTALK